MIEYDLDDIVVSEIHSILADKIIQRNHYLKSTPAGARHRYIIVAKLKGIIGAAMWGRPVARNEDQLDTLELTRFWTEDNSPKNTESFALSRMMKDLKNKGYKRLIAYASIGKGHKGTIYKATNWEEVKRTKGGKGDAWESREGRTNRDLSPKIKFEYVLAEGSA